MKFRLYVIYLLVALPLTVLSQSIALKEVSGLPTREIYDLFIDKRGFLWIAHDLGVSRFDGINFVNFYNQKQTSLSGTGLLEDAQGRIWFNNFTGQIFYIENEKMHLLTDYDYKKEPTFPRIALYKGQIVATSKKGLFFCDTKTLKSRYVTCTNLPGVGTTSLAIMSNKIVAYGAGKWFVYKDDDNLRSVPLDGKNAAIIQANSSTLNSTTLNDTAFVTSNPAGTVSKVIATDTSITVCEQKIYKYFINTVSFDAGKIWINTTQSSFAMGATQQIDGYNLSDIVTDKEGNTWYSSLKQGLFVHYKQVDWNKVETPGNTQDDLVKSIQGSNDKLMLGTQGGKLLVYDSRKSKIVEQLSLPLQVAPVNTIYPIDSENYLICTSVNTYTLNIKTKAFKPIMAAAVKQVAGTDNSICLASATGLLIYPKKYSPEWEEQVQKQFAGISIQRSTKPYFFIYKQRCRAICYDPYSQSLYVSFKDGIYYINSKGIFPFLYKNAPVYSISLIYTNGKVIIGTIDNGLIIIDHGKVTNINASNGLSTSAVIKMKAFGDHLWILGAGSIQVIDLKTLTFINNYNLPSISDANIVDFEELNDTAYIATSTMLYKVPLTKPAYIPRFSNYLLGVNISNKDTVLSNNPSLHNYENDIQFNLGVPIYHNANYVYFKYRLKGANNNQWQVTKPGDRTITFQSLMPGNYTLEAIAQHPQMGPADGAIIYKFTILPPWWSSWWFKLLLVSGIAVVVTIIVRIYYLNRLSKQKIAYEKELAIQDERHRISSEMHDDIGAGLSAIKLFAGMAKTKSDTNNVIEMNKIYTMLTDLSDKIREVIWSLNVDNDSLENLLYYVQFQATKVFQYSDIEFDTDMPDTLPAIVINGVMRRNVYLVIKELLHNALKHSQAKAVNLDFKILHDNLIINIQDNGIGIKNVKGTPDSMGLKSINHRVNMLKGKITLTSENGTKIHIKIPLESLKGI